MKTTWAIVIGVIGIIIGCFGVIEGGQLIMAPKIMEFQKKMFYNMQDSIEQQEDNSSQKESYKEMLETMEEFWDVPDWFNTYCLVAGIISILTSGFYIFSSIRLLQIKPNAIKLFYTAVGLTIGFSILQIVLSIATMPYSPIAIVTGVVFGVVMHGVLLVIVMTRNKEAFTSQKA